MPVTSAVDPPHRGQDSSAQQSPARGHVEGVGGAARKPRAGGWCVEPPRPGAVGRGWDGLQDSVACMALGAASGRRVQGTHPDGTRTGSLQSGTGPHLRSSAGSRPLTRIPRHASSGLEFEGVLRVSQFPPIDSSGCEMPPALTGRICAGYLIVEKKILAVCNHPGTGRD